MRVCQSSQSQQGSCGFFGSGGYLLYEITEGQVRGSDHCMLMEQPISCSAITHYETDVAYKLWQLVVEKVLPGPVWVLYLNQVTKNVPQSSDKDCTSIK